jgi:hypothetical protein
MLALKAEKKKKKKANWPIDKNIWIPFSWHGFRRLYHQLQFFQCQMMAISILKITITSC